MLAQTLNTHFLITVEYYCLIVQGYEGVGGGDSLPFMSGRTQLNAA